MNTVTVYDGRGTTFNGQVELTIIHCGECGGVYAINERYRKQVYDNGGYWTCPYCKGSWGYDKQETELARTKRALEQEQARVSRIRDERDTAERQRRAQKAAKTRLIKRIKGGECPCCGKRFVDLHAHMHDQHPTYGE